ncbi:hypothetical protein AADX85_15940, partial [Staphylococcus epidermidis]
NSAVGWVKSDLIEVSDQAPATVKKTTTAESESTDTDTSSSAIKSVTTQLDNTKLRTGPDVSYQYTQSYPANTKLTYINKSG